MVTLAQAKDIATIAALLCGGIYFVFKAYTGYFRVNLSLFVRCIRESESATHDVLVIYARLAKGANGSLTLHDVQARVSQGGSNEFVTFHGIERSKYEGTTQPFERKAIVWGSVNTESANLRLIPGEEAELAAYCNVPVNSVCLVEVAVLGQQTNRHPFGQWKTSCVSLPKLPLSQHPETGFAAICTQQKSTL